MLTQESHKGNPDELENPVRYSVDVEAVRSNEGRTIEQLCETFDTILETTAKDYGHAVRAVHAKSHGILKGMMRVEGGLPPDLAQGLFATPGEHRVFMRLSTHAGDILPDTISLSRGLTLKVLDVAGERGSPRAGPRGARRNKTRP